MNEEFKIIIASVIVDALSSCNFGMLEVLIWYPVMFFEFKQIFFWNVYKTRILKKRMNYQLKLMKSPIIVSKMLQLTIIRSRLNF